MNIGNLVSFVHSTKTDRSGKEHKSIMTGRIAGYAASGGYLIEVTTGAMIGTICNRPESDILEVI